MKTGEIRFTTDGEGYSAKNLFVGAEGAAPFNTMGQDLEETGRQSPSEI